MRARLLALGALALGASACDGGLNEPSFGVTLRVSVTLTGIDLDSDGFQIFVGGSSGVASSARFLADATANFSLASGSYAVTVADLAPNCSTQEPSPFQIDVPASPAPGNAATLTVRITCLAATASIEVLVQGTGRDFPLDGFIVTLTSPFHSLSQPARANLPTGFGQLAAGTYTVGIGAVPNHCVASDATPKTVSVTVGGAVRDVQQVGFAVSCQAITGDVIMTIRTTGPNSGSIVYQVLIDGQQVRVSVPDFYYSYYVDIPLQLPSNGIHLIERIAPGDRTVELTAVPSSCSVAGGNQRNVSVPLGETAPVTFDVVCA